MTNTLSLPSLNLSVLLTPGANKNTRSRLSQYAAWLDDTGRGWSTPDLTAYRDYLLDRGLQASSVSAHLSSVRGRYHDLLRTNEVRDALFTLAAARLELDGADDTPANRKAYGDEMITRIQNAISPNVAKVNETVKQDRADSEHIRLTVEQARALIAAPGIDTLKGLRDTAIISLMLCTGIREAELCALVVDDLRQRLGGHLALLVAHGKGNKQRLVPYGEHEWALAVVDAWMRRAEITSGPVFRSFTSTISQDDPLSNVQEKALSERALQKTLERYPIMVDGEMRCARPHDLRRTYSRRLYEAGVAPIAIQQNLGHSNLQTTLGYIGALDASARKPPSVFVPPFKLNEL